MSRLPDLGMLATIARQELRIVLRSRWMVAYTLVLGAITLAVSYFGLSVIEFTGFQSFDRTAVSLLNLVLYIVPLGTMLMAVQSFRPEGGATDQLFVEPVSFGEIVGGKLLGLSAAHILGTTIGFGFTGILVGAKVGVSSLGAYLALMGFTCLVGTVFLSLGALLTILSRRQVRAYAVVLAAWFVLVLLFDLLIIGFSFMLPERAANMAAFVGVFLNPIDAARVGAMLAISGRELFGPAGALLVRNLGGALTSSLALVVTLVGWTVLPGIAAALVLRRQDL